MTNTPSPTDEDRELIERAQQLREECRVGVEDRGVMPDYVDACVALRHLAPKLLGVAESLLSDRAKLEEALIDIRNRVLCPVGPSPTIDALQEIASAALTSRTDHTP